MDENNNRITLISRIVTIALAVFTTINGTFSTKLNAKARDDNEDPSRDNQDTKSRHNNSTLVSADLSKNLFLNNASQSGSTSSLNRQYYHYYNEAVSSITSNVINHALQSSATKSVDNIESSAVTSNIFKRHTIRSSFTSINNYYDRPSDVAAASSVAQPKYYNQGRSSGLDKLAIQNRYPASFQSLSNIYQSASVKVDYDRSRASNAYQYASEYQSLNNRNHREAFSWHTESNAINPQLYQDSLGRQYQGLSSSANYISKVSEGLARANSLFKQIHKFDHNPLYRGLINLRMNNDAKSLTNVNQSLADNNQALGNASVSGHNALHSSVLVKLDALKAKNQILVNKENKLLNKWKLDSFLMSKESEPLNIDHFYNQYLNKLVNINNRIYHGTFGMKIYGFDPATNKYRLLIKKTVNTKTRMQFNANDLSSIKRAINHIYRPASHMSKHKALFQANDVVLPKSIFEFLKAHHYRLANGQSIERNLMLCSVQITKRGGDLNLFIKFHHCNGLNNLNRLSGHNDVIEMIPVLHGYYPLGNHDVTDVINEMLSVGHQQSLKGRFHDASGAVNSLVHKYQASLSDFMSCSGLEKELASARYFAHSYASVVKSDEGNLSLASVGLDDFYINHAHPTPDVSKNRPDNYSLSYYRRWHHIPQYIYVDKGLPIYTIAHQLIGTTKDDLLQVTGIGLDHNGQLLYKVSNQHPLGYVPADSHFIQNAYYSAKNNVLAKVKRPTSVYRDAKLTVPFKKLSTNSRVVGKIMSLNNIGSEKTIFKTNNENYLPADTQTLKIIKNLKIN